MKIKLAVTTWLALVFVGTAVTSFAQEKKPNILVIFGDDVGRTNLSAYSEKTERSYTPSSD